MRAAAVMDQIAAIGQINTGAQATAGICSAAPSPIVAMETLVKSNHAIRPIVATDAVAGRRAGGRSAVAGQMVAAAAAIVAGRTAVAGQMVVAAVAIVAAGAIVVGVRG